MKFVLVLIVALLSGVAQAQEAAPVERVYDVAFPDGYEMRDLKWSPDGRYFAVQLSRSVILKWQVYASADGRLIHDGEFVAWYADGSRMLAADASGVSAINLETGAVEFTLPHESLDFAGSHYTFLSWMTWLEGMPQEWISDEILMFDVSSLSGEISPDEPNFFVYDSQTGEEIFSLAGVWRPPVYLPGREQVVVSRLPLGLDIYARSTWQVTDSLDGFVVPYARRWWDNDGSHLLVAATTVREDIEPPEGWDYHFWAHGEGLSAPFRGVGQSAAWITGTGSKAWVNRSNQIVFYDTDTGVQDFAVEYQPETPGIVFIEGRSSRYLLVFKALEDGTRTYAVWDAENAVWIPISDSGFGSVEMRGDTLAIVSHGAFFSLHNLSDGSEQVVFEYGDPYLEFSPDRRFALTISYVLESEPRTATLYTLASGETFSFEVGAVSGQVFWQPDGGGFALLNLERNSVSIWRLNE